MAPGRVEKWLAMAASEHMPAKRLPVLASCTRDIIQRAKSATS